jgi:hypothetical protein
MDVAKAKITIVVFSVVFIVLFLNVSLYGKTQQLQ